MIFKANECAKTRVSLEMEEDEFYMRY